MRRCWPATGLLVYVVASSAPAAAREASGGAESAGAGGAPAGVAPAGVQVEQRPSRWHGSLLLFDQSVTTQTLGAGGDYQSYDPTYEWWIAFKPRYTLFETARNAVSLNLWMNAYLELTNSDST